MEDDIASEKSLFKIGIFIQHCNTGTFSTPFKRICQPTPCDELIGMVEAHRDIFYSYT